MELPEGTITFFFSDIEGSTPLWERHPEAMRTALARHDSLLRSTIKEHMGVVFKSSGDGFYAVFSRAEDGLACALAGQRALNNTKWEPEIGTLRVRMALHTGTAELRENDYFGPSLNLVARLESMAHGGQILLSGTTQELVRDKLPAGVTTLDLGQQRIKGLERPHRVYQVAAPDLPKEFPALQKRFVRRALPRQSTPFIGREKEVDEVRSLVSSPDNRLVTLIGPGGIGKSRLAVEVAATSEMDYGHGVYFVPLAPLKSADDILPVLVESIGQRFHGRADPEVQLLDYLDKKQMLLLMDNFEHILDGVELVTKILKNTGQVKILVTSRERLRLTNEAVYMLGGLAYPDGPNGSQDAASLDKSQYGAVSLLLRQARLVRTDFNPTPMEMEEMVRICRLVRGMPLAIVLAAGWLELLSLKEIGDEISQNLDILQGQTRDVPERQRSVRATFDYSWQRLPDQDRRVFMRLAVFRGGFSRKAAKVITGANLLNLRSLAEKSLISAVRPDRYDVHELLRHFAEEKLEESGQADETRDDHSAYYLNALHQREADIKGPRQVEAFDNIETDLENVRAAWLWALERGDVAGIDKAFESVYLYFDLSSRFREGSRLFDRARNKLAIDKDSITWSRLLTRHAWLRSRSAIAEPEIGEDISLGLAIAKREDNLPEIAFSKLSFGSFQSQVMNDFEGALKTFQQSLEAYQALGDKFYMAKAFHRIGYCSSSVTEGYEKFIDFTRKALDLSRETGNKVDAAMALTNLGSGFLPYGDLTTVKSYLGEAIEIAEEIGDKLTIAHATILMSIHDLLSGDVERARSRARYGLSIVEGTGYHNTIAYGLAAMCLTTAISGDFQQALHFGKLSLAEHSNKFGLVNGHWAMSIAYIGTGQMALARRHLGTAFEIHEQFGWPKKSSWLLPPAAVILANDGQETRAVELLSLVFNHPLSPTGWLEQWSVIDELRQELKQQLGQDAYESAWKRGQSLDLETAFSRLQVEISS